MTFIKKQQKNWFNFQVWKWLEGFIVQEKPKLVDRSKKYSFGSLSLPILCILKKLFNWQNFEEQIMFSISAINSTLNILIIIYYNNFYFYCNKLPFDAFKIVVVWRHFNLWMQLTNKCATYDVELDAWQFTKLWKRPKYFNHFKNFNSSRMQLKMKTYLYKHYSKKNFALCKVRRFVLKVNHVLQVGIWTILRRFVSWA